MNLGDFGLRKSPADEHRSKAEREFEASLRNAFSCSLCLLLESMHEIKGLNILGKHPQPSLLDEVSGCKYKYS